MPITTVLCLVFCLGAVQVAPAVSEVPDLSDGRVIHVVAEGSASSLAIGDFGRDGMSDLAVLETFRASSRLTLIPDLVELSRRVPSQLVLDAAFDRFLIGDIDADGRDELLLGASHSGAIRVVQVEVADYRVVGMALGPERKLPGRIDAWVIGDVNGRDGVPDLVVSTWDGGVPRVLVFEGPQGAFDAEVESVAIASAAEHLAVFDAEGGDGVSSVAIASGRSLQVLLGRNRKLSLGKDQRRSVADPIVRTGRFDSRVRDLQRIQETGPDGTLISRRAAGDGVILDGGEGVVWMGADGSIRYRGALLSTLVVNDFRTGADAIPGDGVCETNVGLGICTLQAAIDEANALPGADTIEFNLGTGTPRIVPVNPLPAITEALTIEGASGGATRIEIQGSSVAVSGIVVDSDNVTLRSLVINGFGQDGVQLNGTGNVVEDCYVGTDAVGGGSVAGNGRDGIRIGGSGNRVGGVGPAQRNVVANNVESGLHIDDSSNNEIVGNIIGLDATGSSALPQQVGVRIWGSGQSEANVIGGVSVSPGSPPGNIIAGHAVHDIELDVTRNNLIQGNLVGTDATGAQRIGGGVIRIGGTGSTLNNLVGGAVPTLRNVLGGLDILGTSTTGTLVQGNYIGLAADGQTALGGLCVNIDGVGPGLSEQTIGGIAPAPGSPPGNVISGCDQDGVFSRYANLDIDGNLIGLAADGLTSVGNSGRGIDWFPNFGVEEGSLRLGGAESGERNVIAGNGTDGVFAFDGNGVTVRRNWIGIDVAGNPAPNGGHGLVIDDVPGYIGLQIDPEPNVISCNGGHGVLVTGGPNAQVAFESNLIGVLPDGTTPCGNTGAGIRLERGQVDVGRERPATGVCEGACNLIAYNGEDGVTVVPVGGARLIGNEIRDNGGLAIDREADGISINVPQSSRNKPVLLSVSQNGTDRDVFGSLNAFPNQSYDIHVYGILAEDPSGHGEMDSYVGKTSCATDAAGDCQWSVTCMDYPFYTATARGFHTSEMALNLGGQPADADGDGVIDGLDNCPQSSNAQQLDSDADGWGDVCDNCPQEFNTGQLDTDGDDAGDACDCTPNIFGTDPPPSVATVSGSRVSGVDTSVEWASLSEATSYSVTRGLLSLLAPGLYGRCFVEPVTGTSVADSQVPPRGDGFFYLVQAFNGCGLGTLGMDSTGAERINVDPLGCVGAP
ncbi:hypothetical protein ABI59_22115 [Acidobacteria bacterium Mor1]|nr:hypothetical protein ABI59_22115 [Acidobacteria bacterium Mor1]